MAPRRSERKFPWLLTIGLLLGAGRVSSQLSLLVGVCASFLFSRAKTPEITRALQSQAQTWNKAIMPVALSLMGAALPISGVWDLGLSSFGATAAGLLLAFAAGHVLKRLLNTPSNLSILLSAGTAICGGSAIMAVSPVIRATPLETGVAMSVVFLLNAVALFAFPLIGQALGLSQDQFGFWAGMAIHDTSSVVGAAQTYGSAALALAVLVKLTRALWILPIVMALGWIKAPVHSTRSQGLWGRIQSLPSIPKFIFGFLAFSAFFSHFQSLEDFRAATVLVSRGLFVACLFWVGFGMDSKQLLRLAPRSILHALALWIVVSLFTLTGISIFYENRM